MKLSTACLLLGLCHLGSATALGLGDLSMRSYLGQPLHATVAVLGATPELTADCFHVSSGNGSIAAPLQARLSLERSGDQATLHIRTPQAVNDPIAQFVLVTDCESRLQRDYVVLLDPPPNVTTPLASGPATTAPASAPATAGTSRAHAPALPKARAAKPAARKTTARANHDDKPHLVLSGRHRSMPEAERPFALRFDTALPDLTRPREEPLTATELSDENTALTRKLAHLETQLAALQQRNAELEALQQRKAASPVAPPPAPAAPQWPLYLLALGLLGTAALLVAWMRRRAHTAPDTVLPDVLAWTPSAEPPADNADGMETAPPLHAVHAYPGRADPPLSPAQAEGTEVKEDILDQAEVFMAHGHGDLAVHLLQEHLRETPTESPVPWLLLLDLLHRAGDTAGYAAASAECRRYFNVNLSGHPISQDGNEPGPGLEAYPHLLEKLVHVWSTPEVGAFFEDLIYDKRGGTRIGFEPGAYRDILLLRDIAQQALPLAA